MTELEAKHMQLVDRVNNSKTREEYWQCKEHLSGFREGVEACGRNRGQLLIHADLVQESRGIDRDMCGGVWLDWEPQADIDKPGDRFMVTQSGELVPIGVEP